MKILAYGVRDDEKPYFKTWQAAHPEVTVSLTPAILDEHSVDEAAGCDGISILQTDPVGPAVFERLVKENVRAVSSRIVGTDAMALDTAKKLGIKVTNVPAYSPAAIAEFTVSQLLQLLRNTRRFEAKIHAQDFRWAPDVSQELNQQTVGVIGTGRIGRAAIKIYRGFGAKVVAYDVYHNPELEKEGIYVDTLADLYQASTVITLHAPATKDDFHMLDQDAFDQMNDGVWIVNAGRGTLIDSQALITALDSGKVAGSALDTYEKELPIFNHDLRGQQIDDPTFNNLFARENVLMTPHIAFYTNMAVKNMVTVSLDHNLSLIQTGASEDQVI
ncbi:MAG: D-2-hydroxyacid dehydrogenase [Furfurilactobacillus sp.]|jgi:D-lactate dehydrogenase|uniref:D-2-hydroxyacid dehydrogenase n=1 Tax=Furfurilactobacillus milii TaxID=2888272 RepID=A0ABT6D6Z7_9LACO|nr:MULTISPECIES: D-2-hydroxyacid dehydrogenase [Furfurilactobacillus]QLE66441.1 D-lactate dehydrogenase [Furfurilactobacillus rossiae]MCF6159898.1 D-2-hydroxyacid dehydrogenase [Furfurilactobacillus milii]MCF6162553.1 D-2-hydroxyacid dehydrogenase [Furfurilactobacillus milii]MCF6419276.1 D-2-hydroxyacid dehydrogenase [Furfurilactobacillus milii]MCH4010848.1 D-2-hydroxyacid dehydrogenase [Furfurilactobacillus sp.]